MSTNKRLKTAKGKAAETAYTTPPSQQETPYSGRSFPKLECNACGDIMVSQRHLACHAKSFPKGSCLGRKAFVRKPRVQHTADSLKAALASYGAGSIGPKEAVRIAKPITFMALHQQDATRSLLAPSSKTGVRFNTQTICMDYKCLECDGNVTYQPGKRCLRGCCGVVEARVSNL